MRLDRWLASADAVSRHYTGAARFLAGNQSDGHPGSVIFSSCAPSAGVTTAVLGVARTMHRFLDRRVLIVELNQSRPLLGRLFGLDPERTLRHVTEDGLQPCDGVQKVEDGLDVLPADWTDRSSEAAPVLTGTISSILSGAEGSYDIVLFDAPPVLHAGEVRSTGAVVPRVVLVLRSAQTRSQVIDRVTEDLERDDIHVIGSIVTARQDMIPSWLYRRIA